MNKAEFRKIWLALKPNQRKEYLDIINSEAEIDGERNNK